MSAIVCNTRALTGPWSGVQRYIDAVLATAPADVTTIAPRRPRHGANGHLWEQLTLPLMLKDRLLWSPSNSGPLATRRQVVTVHDLVPVEHPEWVSPTFGAWYRFVLPRLMARVTHVIAISSFTKGTICANFGVPEERVSVVLNGVDARFTPQPEERIEAALQASRIPTRRYVLSVCSLEPRKNLKRLLAAWEGIASSIDDDISLVLAGRYGVRHIFPALELGRLPDRVHLAGHVSDAHLPALMAGALAFVYPSLYEGFGLPPLEAMASGAPVLTSNTTAIPEVVDGAAMLVDPTRTDDIAHGLFRLLQSSELRSEMRTRGLERARQLSWRSCADETTRILRSVATSGAMS